MELKETAAKVRELFGCQDGQFFHDAVGEVLVSPARDSIFEQFEALVGGLEEDLLQRIHQFWYADRAGKKQDYTPRSLADLVAELTAGEGPYSVYDFCAGTGAMTLAHWRRNKDIVVLCEEVDWRNIPLLLFNLAIRNIGGHVVQRDILTHQWWNAYRLTRGERYARIEMCEPPQRTAYDAVISNPPFNLAWEPVVDARVPGEMKEAILKSKGNANAAFILHALHYLEDGGKAALILPMGSTTGGGAEQAVRGYLTNTRQLRSVIRCPASMFESTNIPTSVFLMGDASNSAPVFIDAKDECVKEIRDQRGEGSPSHTNRIYHKEMNAFSARNIENISSAIIGGANVAGFSGVATLEKIKETGYLFSPGRYIVQKEAETKHRPYEYIVADIMRVNEERNKVKITMNETVAKGFGLYELAESVKESNEITDRINQTSGKVLNFTLPKADYFRLSKNAGEVKIENKSKSEISSLFMILLPMYKQHLFYLNEEENRLLAELRDAMLPDLMSGKIDVSQIEI